MQNYTAIQGLPSEMTNTTTSTLLRIPKYESESIAYFLLNSDEHVSDDSPADAPQYESSEHESQHGMSSPNGHIFRKHADEVAPGYPTMVPMVDVAHLVADHDRHSLGTGRHPLIQGMLRLLLLAMFFNDFWEIPFFPVAFENETVRCCLVGLVASHLFFG